MAALTPFINDVEEKVICFICSKTFTDPKTLPCLHSYCTKCITQLYEKSEELGEVYACPQCQTRIDLSEGRDADQRRSFYIDALLKLLVAMKNSSIQDKEEEEDMIRSECTSCEKYANLVAFCPQCKGMICQECLGAHKSVNQLRRKHQVAMLNEFKQENLKDFVEKQMFCMEESHEENSDQPMGQYFYCKEETCKRFICQCCLLLAHRNHNTEMVEKAGKQFKKTIKEDIDRLKKVKEGYEEELSLSNQNMARILSEVELARLKIDEEKDALIKMVNDHAKAMDEALDKLLLDQRTAYQGEQSTINEVKKQVTEYQGRCQNVIERNITYDMFERQELIQERTKALSQPSFKAMKRLRVRYRSGDYADFLDSGIAGSIVESVIDPSRSSIESLKEVRQCFLNEFEVVTRNADGKMWYAPEETIDISITEVNDNDKGAIYFKFKNFLNKEIIDEKNGRYRVRFRAPEATQCEITARIRGEPIKNSPQRVNTIDFSSRIESVATFGEYGAGKGKLKIPRSIAANKSGKIAVVDSHHIQIFSASGEHLVEIGCKGTEDGELSRPFGVVFIRENKIMVSDQPDDNGRIQEFNINGSYLRTVYRSKDTCVPRGMCVADDKIAVCCWGDINRGVRHSIMLFSKEGVFIEAFHCTEKEERPLHISFSGDKYFVSFVDKNYVRVFDKYGYLLCVFGEEGGLYGQFDKVQGLAAYGPKSVLICDADNHRIQKLTGKGKFQMSFGSGGSDEDEMLYPCDVAVAADGQVFVLELEGKRVHVWK
ncbi:E3 ubiquitin-protein ligase TRIM71-like [Actinia tenebrosa]|uniref:E3 ubiquitin-protein ligase TRIM71-like n=1 Tax=Actinia tenebrosa TaxID=6105 RepID=A0A6P8HE24_ACTTE|nr:E3 ubiquitin-protein ligase TRIM71-like [Actinia tenebrosa]